MPQVASHDHFSSALINVSLSDTSTRNIDHGLHCCSGTICAVWLVDSFAETVAKMFPASEDWHFKDGVQQLPAAAGHREACETTRTTAVSSADYTLCLLPCFVMISVGDALSKFSPFSLDNCR